MSIKKIWFSTENVQSRLYSIIFVCQPCPGVKTNTQIGIQKMRTSARFGRGASNLSGWFGWVLMAELSKFFKICRVLEVWSTSELKNRYGCGLWYTVTPLVMSKNSWLNPKQFIWGCLKHCLCKKKVNSMKCAYSVAVLTLMLFCSIFCRYKMFL